MAPSARPGSESWTILLVCASGPSGAMEDSLRAPLHVGRAWGGLMGLLNSCISGTPSCPEAIGESMRQLGLTSRMEVCCCLCAIVLWLPDPHCFAFWLH